MEALHTNGGRTDEPDENWLQVSLAENKRFASECFKHSPNRLALLHEHENERACVATEDELTTYIGRDSIIRDSNDIVRLDMRKTHAAVNTGNEQVADRPFNHLTRGKE